MSKERELLLRWLNDFGNIHPYIGLLKDTKELLAQPEEEPVAWQYRTRPEWKEQWSIWGDCTKETYEDYSRAPLLHTWVYETRKLYTSPPKQKPLSEVTKATYFPRQLTEKEINEFCGYKDMKVFVVTAYRFGDREKHSYVVGVFDDLERAIHHAKAEREWRAGKYECEVISMPLNASKQNRQHEVLYKIERGVEYELQPLVE